MKTNPINAKRLAFIIIPFILITLIMLPRLMSPQFGFFDDARMLSQSKKFLQGDFSMSHDKQAGRFRPVYWLYFTVVYALAGYHPFWFFLGNLFIFFILIFELRLILKDMGFAEWQIFTTSLIFIFTMPVIENFYTLSKGEPLQLIFVLASVIFGQKIKSQNSSQWLAAGLASLSFLFAVMVKETAIVMLPVTFLWLVYTFFPKKDALRQERKSLVVLLSAEAAAVMIYFIFRHFSGAAPLLGGTYSDHYLVDLSSLLQKVLRWATQFAFYFHYLLPFITIVLLLIIFKHPIEKQARFNFYRWGVWWLFWYGILIPWEYAELYYLLPFALGSAILIGTILPPMFQAIKSHQHFKRYVISALSLIAGLLFILTLPNYLTDAKTQLTFDRVNQEMLNYVVDFASKDAAIYTNIETSNEYSEKLEVYLREHYQLDAISYDHINAVRMENLNEHMGAILLMPFINNQPRLTVRAGVEEIYQDRWNNKLLTQTETSRSRLASFNGSFQLSNINLPVLLCPLLGQHGFCENPDPIIDTRLFSYGWEVFQIQ
jgi:hypothetical protein